MKTALLHYWLVRERGGEKVLAALHGLLPGADVFTHAWDRRLDFGLAGARIRETFIGRLPFARRHPQAYLPLMMSAARRLDLSAYDLVVSSESGPIKGIRKRSGQRHVCYCHTPMRYVWDLYDEYYRTAGPFGRLAMRTFRGFLRREDLRSADAVDAFVANSQFVAERIKRIYGRESTVVPPPVDVDFFSAAAPSGTDDPYYLFVGAPVGYKRLDLARAACARMGRRLEVVDGGLSREELRARYAGARALLFPGIEDFGIVPVEAQAAGTPVIAYGQGGALETVVDGETGLFFREPTVDALCAAIETFESRRWDAARCREQARRFRPEAFAQGMRSVLGH